MIKPLRFIHVPKTAGSTLAYLLLRQHRGKRYFYFTGETRSDAERYSRLTENQRREIRLFLGHAPITTGFREADEAILITLLRDPVDRVKSFCQHVSEGKAPYLQKDHPSESFDLDKFLASGNYEISNMQTKMLINKESCASPLLIHRISKSAAKDLTLENLFHVVSCFGIQDLFDESIIMFSQFLRWKMPFYLSENVKDTSRLLDFQPRHLDQIKELNSIDIEVYAAAKNKFLELIASPNFDSARLKRFKLLKPLANPILRIGRRARNSA